MVSAPSWPSFDAEVEATRLVASPSFDSCSSCSLVARPRPWTSPNPRTAARGIQSPVQVAEPIDVLKALVDHGQANDGIHQEGIGAPAQQHGAQQRHAVAQRKEAGVERHIPQPVQEENDAGEEKQVVVARDHVLGAQVQRRAEIHALHARDEQRVAAGDPMREGNRRQAASRR